MDRSSGMPVCSIIASKLINRAALRRRIKYASSHKRTNLCCENDLQCIRQPCAWSEAFKHSVHVPIKSKVFFDDNLKVMSQDKWHSLSPYTKLDLEVSEEVSIVNVEELATLCHHDVVRVTVSNAQHVCSNTVTSTRSTETLSSLLKSANKTLYSIIIM